MVPYSAVFLLFSCGGGVEGAEFVCVGSFGSGFSTDMHDCRSATRWRGDFETLMSNFLGPAEFEETGGEVGGIVPNLETELDGEEGERVEDRWGEGEARDG
jgi:hypothetical protein